MSVHSCKSLMDMYAIVFGIASLSFDIDGILCMALHIE